MYNAPPFYPWPHRWYQRIRRATRHLMGHLSHSTDVLSVHWIALTVSGLWTDGDAVHVVGGVAADQVPVSFTAGLFKPQRGNDEPRKPTGTALKCRCRCENTTYLILPSGRHQPSAEMRKAQMVPIPSGEPLHIHTR